tara:strand:- start:151 stop:516 length:366 start_codon:yes stop_codon:yes gene_type:complete
MTGRERKDLRGYIGSGIVFLFVIALLFFLSVKEIPASNNDSFKLIVGALIATIGAAIYVFIGKDPNELQELQRRNDSLEMKINQLVEQKDQLEGMIIKMQEEMLDKVFLKLALDYDDKKRA